MLAGKQRASVVPTAASRRYPYGMNENTFERAGRVIAKYLEIAVEAVEPDSHLMDDLGLDSIAALEIVFDLEEEFGIVVPEEDISAFTTVRTVCEGIDKLVANPPVT